MIVLRSELQEGRGERWTTPTTFSKVPVTDEQRRKETTAACEILRCQVEFWPFSDARPDWTSIERTIRSRWANTDTHLYVPAAHESGHEHHNGLAIACDTLPVDRVTRYTTYVRGTPDRRVQGRVAVEPPTFGIQRKLLALAAYESQCQLWPHHFLADQSEWYA